MRIAHVITRLVVGGAQENTLSTVFGLLKKPDCALLLISGPGAGPEGSLISTVQDIPGLLEITPNLIRPVNPIKDLKAYFELKNIYKRFRPDIVHTHSGKAGILGRLAARAAKTPLIIHTIHGPSFGPFQGHVANSIFRTAELFAGRYTNHFISVADAMTRQYLQAGIGRPDQYTRVLSGFSLNPFLNAKNDPGLRSRLGLNPEHFVVGKIARFFRLKGHEDLFEAAPEIVNRHPNVRFLLIGGGELEPFYKKRAIELGLQGNFVFTGLIPPEEIPKYVGIMNMLVHLSLREGLPRVLPQALAAGKPVVAYDCDGAGEVCINNKTGFLIKPGELSDLSDAICLLADDPALCARLGTAGQEMVRELFSVETMVDSIYSLYTRLLARK